MGNSVFCQVSNSELKNTVENFTHILNNSKHWEDHIHFVFYFFPRIAIITASLIRNIAFNFQFLGRASTSALDEMILAARPWQEINFAFSSKFGSVAFLFNVEKGFYNRPLRYRVLIPIQRCLVCTSKETRGINRLQPLMNLLVLLSVKIHFMCSKPGKVTQG